MQRDSHEATVVLVPDGILGLLMMPMATGFYKSNGVHGEL
jgi:hypothetical protein